MKKLFLIVTAALTTACTTTQTPVDVHHVDEKEGLVHISHPVEHSTQWTATMNKANEVCRDLGFKHAELYENLETTDTHKIVKFECHDSTGRWH
jgi:hypothetical protein